MKCNKNKIIHIGIIVIGTIFILISAFHNNIWFDESYSVSIANHSFSDIWKITSHDVHPPLYYWILHILNLIFGTNIIIYRLFSVLCIILIGILGYTHIKKDFGEKIGILFSYLAFFLPAVCVYSVEIRMYSLAMFLATSMGIYAYRIIKNEFLKKNWIIFAISSLALSYTHYYGLMTAGIVNLILFIYILKNKRDDKRYIKYFLIQAVIEVTLYIPWLVLFIAQAMGVKGGFWIKVVFPDTLVEVLNFQYKGFIDDKFSFNVETIVTLIFAVCFYVYIGYLAIKSYKKDKLNAGIVSILLYMGIIFIALIISKVMQILYSRYLFVITGFLIFGLAYFLSKEKNVIIITAVVTLIIGMSIYNEFKLINKNYADNNFSGINYIKENIKEGDIIIYYKVNMAILNTYFPNNSQYFLNFGYWDVEEAYRAYAPTMKVVENWEFLNDFKGRIWLIDSEDTTYVYDNIDRDIVEIIKDRVSFETGYHDYDLDITLVEKNS